MVPASTATHWGSHHQPAGHCLPVHGPLPGQVALGAEVGGGLRGISCSFIVCAGHWERKSGRHEACAPPAQARPHTRGQPPGSHCKTIPGSHAHSWARSLGGPGCPLALHTPGCHPPVHAFRLGSNCNLNRWSTLVILGLMTGLRHPVLPTRGQGGDACRLQNQQLGASTSSHERGTGTGSTLCQGRDVPVLPPNSYVEIPTPMCDRQERGLWEVIRVRGVP